MVENIKGNDDGNDRTVLQEPKSETDIEHGEENDIVNNDEGTDTSSDDEGTEETSDAVFVPDEGEYAPLYDYSEPIDITDSTEDGGNDRDLLQNTRDGQDGLGTGSLKINISKKMDPDHVSQIKEIMAGFTLSDKAIPEWAKRIPEDRWLPKRREQQQSDTSE